MRKSSFAIVIVLAFVAAACATDDEVPLAPEPHASPSYGSRGWTTQDTALQLTGVTSPQLIASPGECCYTDECDPFPEMLMLEEECPDPSPGAVGLWIPSWDFVGCTVPPIWDPDNDFVDNACENALAQAFAPLMIMAGDCNWDHSPALNRMGGEYYFAVQTSAAADADIRIAYLPAYYYDCGEPVDMLSECGVHGLLFWCPGHSGDSEFILIDLYFNDTTSHWVTQRVFLSEHCLEFTGYGCGWYSADLFRWRDDHQRGAPVVWVGEGKHGNYYAQEKCNLGAFGFDECSYNTIEQVFPVVYEQQNIGSRSTPLRDCAPALSGSPMTSGERWECMWSPNPQGDYFNGWQGATWNGPSTSYGVFLSMYAGF
jgi:hypothetical protein